MTFLVASVIELVMSISWPASTMAAILPPPRCMKMSGAEPEFSAVCSLPSKSSFWSSWMVIFTFGLAFSKSATVFSQYALPGPVVELPQNVMFTVPPLAPVLPPPLLLPLQAVSPRATIVRAAVAARIFLPFMRSVLFVELHRVERWPLAGEIEDRSCFRYVSPSRPYCRATRLGRTAALPRSAVLPRYPSQPQVGVLAGSASATSGGTHRRQWCGLLHHALLVVVDRVTQHNFRRPATH